VGLTRRRVRLKFWRAVRWDVLKSLAGPEVVVLHHDRNAGKGAALRTGFRAATDDMVIIQDADLECDPSEESRFGFEPEITAKIAAMWCRIYEVGISYSGRTYEEAKKIGWKDGPRAVWCIVKYSRSRVPAVPPAGGRPHPS
jgi:glycosyltransferase involved in cell wall biosynthesis